MGKNNCKVRSITPYGGWKRALNAARLTAGKKPLDKEPSDEWKAKMLLAEHSPIRLVEYDGIWDFIKMWVTTHLVRHHIGVEKFVATQRVDRNPDLTGLDRDEIPQGLENTMMISANAQALINMSRKRLCSCASPETREAWKAMLAEIGKVDPILMSKCVPECIYRGFCPEFDRCCGFCNTEKYKKQLEEYRSIKTKPKAEEIDFEELKEAENLMYDENGWMNLGGGLRKDRDGHIAGGLKLSPYDKFKRY